MKNDTPAPITNGDRFENVTATPELILYPTVDAAPMNTDVPEVDTKVTGTLVIPEPTLIELPTLMIDVESPGVIKICVLPIPKVDCKSTVSFEDIVEAVAIHTNVLLAETIGNSTVNPLYAYPAVLPPVYAIETVEPVTIPVGTEET